MNHSKITIAIDGFSSCGKSTLAKALSKKIGYFYVDTGAMYRAVTLYFHQNQIGLDDHPAIIKAMEIIQIHFELIDGKNTTFLNGENIEAEIRKMYISDQVSPVARIAHVRNIVVAQQKKMGDGKGLIMDGRDIGTVVFPNAELKFFMTADPEVRAQRRYAEMQAKKIETSLEEVAANLKKRDHIDSTRKESPLKLAKDAIIIDNTFLSLEEQLFLAEEVVNHSITIAKEGRTIK